MTTRSITTPAAEPQAAVAAIEQPGPSAPAAQARTLWHADGLRARFRGIGERERWGYGVWLFAGLVFGVPESWAGITSPPWPALSDTVGHLEQLWHPVKVIVVTLTVFVVFHAVRYPPGQTGDVAARDDEPKRVRTPCGRLARGGTSAACAVPVLMYYPLALGLIAGGSAIAATAGGAGFVLGYVIYGSIAIFLVIIPNALALWFAKEVPFPTLYRTVANLERRWRPAAVVIVAGLVVLMFHLVFFPWPDTFPRLTATPARATTAAGSSSRAHPPTSSPPAPPSPASTSRPIPGPDPDPRPSGVTRRRFQRGERAGSMPVLT